MAKRQRSGVLKRLEGKKIVFHGKFWYGVEQSLKALAEAQWGTVCADLDDKVDYLVLADLSTGKAVQKKALTLNGRGAAIQLMDVQGFKALVEPTDTELLALLRAGESEIYGNLHDSRHYHATAAPPKYTFHSEDLSKISFLRASLDNIHFEACRFHGTKFEHVTVGSATDCDFSNATGASNCFGNVPKCRFSKAVLPSCQFGGDFSDADFTGATIEEAAFVGSPYFGRPRNQMTTVVGTRFTQAVLTSARFHELHLKSPDFSEANLTKAAFQSCVIESGTFRNATLRGVTFAGCQLAGADFSNADLMEANLAGADLSGAMLSGANLKNANLRGTNLDKVNLSQVKNYDPSGTPSGTVGPALQELDTVNAKAARIHVTFQVRPKEGDSTEAAGIDSSGLRCGWGVQLPPSVGAQQMFNYGGGPLSFSDAMLKLANCAGHLRVCYETLAVTSTKSPKGGRELRDLVMRGIAEAFAQPLPSDDELAAATKQYRDAEREKGSAERELRKQAKAQAAKAKEKVNKQIAKKVEKAVGKVSDVASFLKALEVRIEKPKIDKATQMLKASGFKLFNDVTDEYVSGVVKSQTDPDLVYACRVMHDGQYACCTQNLNICGGLRGSLCKHQLVLIIGLVQAGELDPTTIDAWIAKTHSVKPVLDKELMGEIFIKYKGAEAGEVDWRPTETVPEDYYTF